jgi:hypothetical protein
MSEFAAWTPDPVTEEAPEVPAAALDLSWLPPGVARRQALDEAQHNAELRREERDRQREAERRAEDARDRATAAYLAGALMRGEQPGAMDVMTGDIGRTVDEVLAGSGELADRVPKEHRDPVNYIGDTGGAARRSQSRGDGWPSSAYAVDSLLARADQAHRDFVAARARYNYRAAEAAARDKADPYVERAEAQTPMIYR